MSVLNNIWLALSTPNENLVNLCTAFFAIFMSFPLDKLHRGGG